MIKNSKHKPETKKLIIQSRFANKDKLQEALSNAITSDFQEYETIHRKVNSYLSQLHGKHVDAEFCVLNGGLRIFGKTHPVEYKTEHMGIYAAQKKTFVRLQPTKNIKVVENGTEKGI